MQRSREIARKVHDSRKGFKALIDHYLDKSRLPQNPLHVLNIGCGLAYDAQVIMRAFDHHVEYRGIDTNTRLLEESAFWSPARCRFIKKDARDLDGLPEMHLVLALHPEVSHRKRVWNDIFKAARAIHAPRGILLSTCYKPEELDNLCKMLDPHYTITCAEKTNPAVRERAGVSRFTHTYTLVAERRHPSV